MDGAEGLRSAHWARLVRLCVRDVSCDFPLPLDQQVERALRGQCLGRRNHYGSRSRRGTEVAAIFYSVVETAKLRSEDPSHLLCPARGASGWTKVPHR